MDTQQALLRAILLNPDDDTARLVYADWLQENGHGERAWYIRHQVAAEDVRPPTIDCEREYALAEKHINDWFHLRELSGRKHNRHLNDWHLADYRWPMLRIRPAGYPRGYFGHFCSQLELRRGFIQALHCTFKSYCLCVPFLFDRHPIEHVEIVNLSPGRELVGGRTLPVWCEWSEGLGDWNRGVPAFIFSVMHGARSRSVSVHRNGLNFLAFESDEDARKSLSDACVAYGRSLAGLPPLPGTAAGSPE